jgi:tetratricopeptide (TPR) repeat protein
MPKMSGRGRGPALAALSDVLWAVVWLWQGLPVQPVELPDLHYLRAASGWLELGNPVEAQNELDRLRPELLDHPEVLRIRWHVSAVVKRWDASVEIAGRMVELAPDQAEGWIHRSFALHELRRTEEALSCLLGAVDRFSNSWVIPYNCACYCAQLGRLDEARDWLRRALAIARMDGNETTLRLQAVEDPDLEPLREELGSIGS